MAATIPTQTMTVTGTAITYAAPAGGLDSVIAGNRTFLHVKNGGGASITVTVVVPGNSDWGQALGDVVATVPAGAERMIGPINRRLIIADEGVGVIFSTTTNVTCAAIAVGPVEPSLT